MWSNVTSIFKNCHFEDKTQYLSGQEIDNVVDLHEGCFSSKCGEATVVTEAKFLKAQDSV